MNKQKFLCILHCSPPAHGAAKVGDFIASSQKLSEDFESDSIYAGNPARLIHAL